MRNELQYIQQLKSRMKCEPSIPIEEAASILEIDTRTIRRRNEFERVRKKGHLHVTLRSIKRFIERHQYGPSESYDLRKEIDTQGTMDSSDKE